MDYSYADQRIFQCCNVGTAIFRYTTKANTVKTQDFTQLMQNTNATAQAAGQTDAAAATQEVSEVDEMEAFKQEIYEELAEIDSMTAASVLTNSIHITEDGFQRMKDDPEYRKEIMDWLRADARDSHKVPFDCHVTTTITSAGATSYGISDTATTPQWVNSKAEGRFIVLTAELSSARGTTSM